MANARIYLSGRRGDYFPSPSPTADFWFFTQHPSDDVGKAHRGWNAEVRPLFYKRSAWREEAAGFVCGAQLQLLLLILTG